MTEAKGSVPYMFCEDCRFWNLAPEDPDRANHLGRCQRNPPQSVLLAQGGQMSFFPVTRGSEWCGEHKPKLAS